MGPFPSFRNSGVDVVDRQVDVAVCKVAPPICDGHLHGSREEVVATSTSVLRLVSQASTRTCGPYESRRAGVSSVVDRGSEATAGGSG